MQRGSLIPAVRCARRLRLCAVAIACALGVAQADALTLVGLVLDPDMTPKRFAKLFEDFAWDVHPFDVQDPDQFLESRRGDCIDYAVMADFVLTRHGYHTRLIRVEMEGKNMGHAVCYVSESRAYLDFNNRKYFFKLEHSGATIREIADEVADSFRANWTFAQEFTYSYKTALKLAVFTVVKTDPPAKDPDKTSPQAQHP